MALFSPMIHLRPPSRAHGGACSQCVELLPARLAVVRRGAAFFLVQRAAQVVPLAAQGAVVIADVVKARLAARRFRVPPAFAHPREPRAGHGVGSVGGRMESGKLPSMTSSVRSPLVRS